MRLEAAFLARRLLAGLARMLACGLGSRWPFGRRRACRFACNACNDVGDGRRSADGTHPRAAAHHAAHHATANTCRRPDSLGGRRPVGRGCRGASGYLSIAVLGDPAAGIRGGRWPAGRFQPARCARERAAAASVASLGAVEEEAVLPCMVVPAHARDQEVAVLVGMASGGGAAEGAASATALDAEAAALGCRAVVRREVTEPWRELFEGDFAAAVAIQLDEDLRRRRAIVAARGHSGEGAGVR